MVVIYIQTRQRRSARWSSQRHSSRTRSSTQFLRIAPPPAVISVICFAPIIVRTVNNSAVTDDFLVCAVLNTIIIISVTVSDDFLVLLWHYVRHTFWKWEVLHCVDFRTPLIDMFHMDHFNKYEPGLQYSGVHAHRILQPYHQTMHSHRRGIQNIGRYNIFGQACVQANCRAQFTLFLRHPLFAVTIYRTKQASTFYFWSV